MFTQKISMDCTQKQYEKYLRDELLKMGYKVSRLTDTSEASYITNNYVGQLGAIANLFQNQVKVYGRTYLGSFNPRLFLAYAAMTDKKFGGYGEWWMCIGGSERFTRGNIYKAIAIEKSGIYAPDFMADDGKSGYDSTICFLDYFRKATTDEINERFGKKAVDTEQTPNTENETERCIAHLKDKGYKILRKVVNWEEV